MQPVKVTKLEDVMVIRHKKKRCLILFSMFLRVISFNTGLSLCIYILFESVLTLHIP